MTHHVQTPYIGSKISIISKLDIRYEGILYSVDATNSTIALTKVQSYGTEQRPANNFIPAQEEIFEFVIFRAVDIKDLVVCEGSKTEDSVIGSLPYDPAIVSVSLSVQPVQHQLKPGANEKPGDYVENRGSSSLNRGGPIDYHHSNRRNNSPFFSLNAHHGGGNRYHGQPLRQNIHQGGYSRLPLPWLNQINREDAFVGDYDFEKANKQFQAAFSIIKENNPTKEMTKDESSTEGNNNDCCALVPCENFYDKNSSFFDNISSNSFTHYGRRDNWKRERNTNQETFGSIAVRSLMGYRRGYGRAIGGPSGGHY